ncbi:MAG TPA: GntR family transcriptional regulator [Kofleriaceae bacterium]
MQTVSRPRLRDDIATELTRLIACGELPAVERLKEVELAAKLGVSRTPLREALLVLERDGLVISEVNKGFRVADLSETRVRELFPVIAALEAEALRAGGDATRALGPELLALNAELRRLVRPGAKTAKAKLHELDRRFHATVSSACPNALLLDLLQRLRLQAQRFDGGTARGLADPAWTVREHEAIARAIAAGKLDRAAELTREHRRVGIEIVIGWLREQRGGAGR